MQPYDFGVANNEYEWKSKGAARLLYTLVEKDRFERLKANNLLPERLLDKQTNRAVIEKEEDCTKHFTRMRKEFENAGVDERPYPVQQEDVPNATTQKQLVV